MTAVMSVRAGAVDNSLAAERHKAHMEKTFPKAGNRFYLGPRDLVTWLVALCNT